MKRKYIVEEIEEAVNDNISYTVIGDVINFEETEDKERYYLN